MSPEFMTVAMFATLIIAIAFGHPLAFTLAAVATLFGLIENGGDVAGLFDMFANNTWGLMNNYVLVAIP
ncbi:MAG TPA: C4-dicarboxylate ABC transporter, partial [Desulfofustis sp.]|nr:C4-dicarboxylate ABC transporter [Desulfofustis sp.]